jgi:hypothetical protein
MTEHIPKGALVGGVILAPFVLVFLAYSRPGYFTDMTLFAGLLLVELLVVAIWMYRRLFFPLILLVFLLAGTNLPVGTGWTIARWVVLGVGGWVGFVILVRDRRLHFGPFHIIALFSVLAALVSAAVSRYPGFALLKALSMFLLFAYSATGARLAVVGRETRFFAGLLTGCEVFVAGMAVGYLLGRQVMGNPNSLGAVMGVVAAPILLWGTMVAEKPSVRYRQLLLFVLCMGLVFYSQARAGIAAALISCGLLCLTLRKYKLFAQGLGVLVIVVATTAIIQPEAFSNRISDLNATVLYKGRDPTQGLLASRESPWQAAVDSIRNNFWFGTGFGTTDNGLDASPNPGQFSTGRGVSAENGSSYLAIVSWVGMLCIWPFALLVTAILGGVLRTLVWMLKIGSPSHPAVPLAMVMIAGLFHAGFEDWLFAPGYYLCVFFWSMAFVFVDFAPKSSSPILSASWRASTNRGVVGAVAPSR